MDADLTQNLIQNDFTILHEQIVAWQERRFTVITGAVSLVAVLSGFILSDEKRSWTRQQAITLVCMILTCASLFCWYAGWQNSIIGSFLRTTRETHQGVLGWEQGVAILKQNGDLSNYISLNKIIGLTFLIASVGTSAVFWLHCPKQDGKAPVWVMCSAVAVFVTSLVVLAYPWVTLPNYDAVWNQIHTDFVAEQLQNGKK